MLEVAERAGDQLRANDNSSVLLGDIRIDDGSVIEDDDGGRADTRDHDARSGSVSRGAAARRW